MRFPRYSRICSNFKDRRSVPSNRIFPPVITAGGEATSPVNDNAVTDFPEPLSPTRAKHSPLPM